MIRHRPVTAEPDLLLAPAVNLLVRETPHSVLLSTEHSAQPLVLRGSAAEVWRAFDRGATLRTVAAEMSERFGLDEHEAVHDVTSLVDELRRAGALAPVA